MKTQLSKLLQPQNLVLVVFLVIAVSLMLNTVKVIRRNYELKQRVDTLADKLEIVKLQNQNLRFDVEYYKSDAYLELEARRRFNLAGPNEGVIFLPKDGDVAVGNNYANTPEAVEAESEEPNNFDSWMTFLFGS